MGKGGETTQTSELPEWQQEHVSRNLDRGDDIAAIGHVPWRGPSVAALTDQETAAMRNTRGVARNMGLDVGGPMGLPKAREYGNGFKGYSSMPLYNDAMQRWGETAPAQKAAVEGQVMNPVTGEMPSWHPAAPEKTQPVTPAPTDTSRFIPTGAFDYNGNPTYRDPETGEVTSKLATGLFGGR